MGQASEEVAIPPKKKREESKVEKRKSLMIVKRATFLVGPRVNYNLQPIIDGDG